jgi:hypothetical protein
VPITRPRACVSVCVCVCVWVPHTSTILLVVKDELCRFFLFCLRG